jgi:hypothetical protein
VELNLCPSCSAFVNASWEACGACGAALGQPAAAYVPETASEVVEDPRATSVVGNEQEGFTVQWNSPPPPAVTPEPAWPPAVEPYEPAESSTSTWTAPVEVSNVSTTGGWTAPESTTQHTEEPPVQISWPTPASSVAPATQTPSYHTPSFYNGPANPQAHAAAEVQTFQYDQVTLGGTSGALADGRLRPELSKGVIIAFAAAGPVMLVILILIVSLIGASVNEAEKDVLVDVPSQAVAPTVPAESEAETTPLPAPADDWTDYVEPNGMFKASLPDSPTSEIVPGTDGKGTAWQSVTADGKTLVEVVALQLPAGDFRNNQQILKTWLNASAEAGGMTVKGQIIETKASVLRLDALLEGPSGSSNVRFFVSGQTMYGLNVEGKDASANAVAFDKLTKSFEPLSGKPA